MRSTPYFQKEKLRDEAQLSEEQAAIMSGVLSKYIKSLPPVDLRARIMPSPKRPIRQAEFQPHVSEIEKEKAGILREEQEALAKAGRSRTNNESSARARYLEAMEETSQEHLRMVERARQVQELTNTRHTNSQMGYALNGSYIGLRSTRIYK